MLSQQKEALKTLQQLNEQIVEARRNGAHEEVSRLKEKVRRLLSRQVPPQSPQESSLASQSEAKPETRPEPTHPPAKAPDTRSIMAQLQEVNMKIVEARRAGDDARVQQLQDRAKELMLQGSQPRS